SRFFSKKIAPVAPPAFPQTPMNRTLSADNELHIAHRAPPRLSATFIRFFPLFFARHLDAANAPRCV
ncbi:MAG: hypothetical protein UHP27_09045, partial [Muribaculaceae bacterium]|nr:hypothetical protein [Muribaculaceae bacterium]